MRRGKTGAPSGRRPTGRADAGRGGPGAYLELTKPGITGFVVLSVGVGFVLGVGEPWRVEPAALASRFLDLVLTLLGAALAAGGTNALNQWLEREADARMERTRGRPLPEGRISSSGALTFGLLLAATGPAVLLAVDAVAAGIAAATVLLYDAVYTPLKRRTWLATVVGGVPGALPVLGGWQAAAGGLGTGAWILFTILFLWQLPHFFSLDWLYREDYRRGGFRTLATADPGGRASAAAALGSAVLLAGAALLPWLTGMLGPLYAAGALALGIVVVGPAVGLAISVSRRHARRLFLGTLFYLPAVYLLLVVGAWPW